MNTKYKKYGLEVDVLLLLVHAQTSLLHVNVSSTEFICIQRFCMRAAKVQAGLYNCAGMNAPSLLALAISTNIYMC